MVREDVGLTTTYNRLKDPDDDSVDVRALRALHEAMDRAVLAAYGWSDLAVPPFAAPTDDPTRRAFEDEIIDRLFALNAERAAAEKKKSPAKRAKKKGQGLGFD